MTYSHNWLLIPNSYLVYF